MSFPGSAAGAPGLRSIAWSQGLDGGNSWEASSEKMRSNIEYCGGIWGVEFMVRMYNRPILMACVVLGTFVVLKMNRAFAASGVRSMMGS
jgi:hypothetical protein